MPRSMAHLLLSCPGLSLVTNVVVLAGTSCPSILNPALRSLAGSSPDVHR